MFFSAPVRRMIQKSRPPKIFQMRWSVLFDSTHWCTTQFTLWLVDRSSHVSEWITPLLTLWWTGLWQMMGNMRSCSWEQVRGFFCFFLTPEGSGSHGLSKCSCVSTTNIFSTLRLSLCSLCVFRQRLILTEYKINYTHNMHGLHKK